jgi:hypothetical protein
MFMNINQIIIIAVNFYSNFLIISLGLSLMISNKIASVNIIRYLFYYIMFMLICGLIILLTGLILTVKYPQLMVKYFYLNKTLI